MITQKGINIFLVLAFIAGIWRIGDLESRVGINIRKLEIMTPEVDALLKAAHKHKEAK